MLRIEDGFLNREKNRTVLKSIRSGCVLDVNSQSNLYIFVLIFSESQEIVKAVVLAVISQRDALNICRNLSIFSFFKSLDTRLMNQTTIQCLIKSVTTG